MAYGLSDVGMNRVRAYGCLGVVAYGLSEVGMHMGLGYMDA